MPSGDFTPQIRFFERPAPDSIYRWLLDLRKNAYVPGSHFQVADVLGMKTPNGMLYFGGVNVECLDHRQSVHSEECAIGFLVTAMGKKASVHEAWVMGAPDFIEGPANHPMADKDAQPCGNCRQQILGLSENENIPVHCLSINGHEQIHSIGYLLPEAFQFEDFDEDAANERNAARGYLAPDDPSTIIDRVIRRGPLSCDEIFTWLNMLESVDYASRIGQSAVIALDNGFYVAGVKVENAAYTGLSAMQAALGIATVNFGKVRVQEIYTLSKSRRADMPGDDVVYPLSLPSLQGLNEFVAGPDTPVTLFTGSGDSALMKYSDASDCFSNFSVQAYHISGGRLKVA